MSLPSPWDEFLREVDKLLPEPVRLHCIGGFVLTIHYGLPIATSDVDYVEVIPGPALGQVEQIAGRGSRLYEKYRLYFQYVGVVTLPENYRSRLVEILPGEFQKLRVFIPDPYDLVLSKLERNSPKDRSDVAFLAKRLSLDPETLSDRFRRELRPYLLAHHERHDDNRDRSKVTSSRRARLRVWMMQPSIWLLRPSGLMISPQSWAHTTRFTRTRPDARSTSTSIPIAT